VTENKFHQTTTFYIMYTKSVKIWRSY